MKSTILLTLTICFASLLYSQNNVSFNFNHLLNEDSYSYGQATPVFGDYELKIDRLDYYLSEIEITHDGGIVTAIDGVYLLVQPNVENVYDLGEWDITSVESVQFGFGVDPSVNTDDPAQWPSDHPLSYQMPSMHWGWAAGYRFLAIEGTAGEDFAFEYEIHGLGNDNYGMVNLTYDNLQAEDGVLQIGIDADYAQIFYNVNVQYGDILHGGDLPKIIKALNNCKSLVFSAGDLVNGLTENELEPEFHIAPNPIVNDVLVFTTKNWSTSNYHADIYDMLGKLVKTKSINGPSMTIDVNDIQKGMYLLQLRDDQGNVLTKKFHK